LSLTANTKQNITIQLVCASQFYPTTPLPVFQKTECRPLVEGYSVVISRDQCEFLSTWSSDVLDYFLNVILINRASHVHSVSDSSFNNVIKPM